jgi:hypothetical protein
VYLKNDAGGVIPEQALSPPTTWAGVKVEHCSEIALNAAAGHASPAPQMPFQPPIKLQAFSVLSFLDLRDPRWRARHEPVTVFYSLKTVFSASPRP